MILCGEWYSREGSTGRIKDEEIGGPRLREQRVKVYLEFVAVIHCDDGLPVFAKT